ncbi:MAG: hypothetical protein RIU46_38995 [Deltaproteobacteria bacterium]|jgi:predicted protein tyrosine phosphatase
MREADLPFQLVVLPRAKVGRHLLSRSRGGQYKTVVSIGDPGSRPPPGFRSLGRSTLRLEFEDIVDAENALGPTDRDVTSIINFAPTVRRLGGICLVHCEAGVSRSTAAAAIIARIILGPGSELAAMELACGAVAFAAPNRLMLQLADEQLAADGALVQARADYLLRIDEVARAVQHDDED